MKDDTVLNLVKAVMIGIIGYIIIYFFIIKLFI